MMTPDAEVLLSWNIVAKRIEKLMKEDRYLSAEDKVKYAKYKQKQEEKALQQAKEELGSVADEPEIVSEEMDNVADEPEVVNGEVAGKVDEPKVAAKELDQASEEPEILRKIMCQRIFQQKTM